MRTRYFAPVASRSLPTSRGVTTRWSRGSPARCLRAPPCEVNTRQRHILVRIENLADRLRRGHQRRGRRACTPLGVRSDDGSPLGVELVLEDPGRAARLAVEDTLRSPQPEGQDVHVRFGRARFQAERLVGGDPPGWSSLSRDVALLPRAPGTARADRAKRSDASRSPSDIASPSRRSLAVTQFHCQNERNEHESHAIGEDDRRVADQNSIGQP